MADVTPMSRTLPARLEKASASVSGRPNSLTSRAPETLKRSVIIWPISPFRRYFSRVISASRRPVQRAGSTNRGSSGERQQRDLPRQDEHRGERGDDGEHVADDAGEGRRERLLGTLHVAVQPGHEGTRLGSAEEADRHPLDVVEHLGAQVVDEALAECGAENQRWAMPLIADSTARPATSPASPTTRPVRPCSMPWSMIALKISGVAAPAMVSMTMGHQEHDASPQRYGLAKPATRRSVSDTQAVVDDGAVLGEGAEVVRHAGAFRRRIKSAELISW